MVDCWSHGLHPDTESIVLARSPDRVVATHQSLNLGTLESVLFGFPMTNYRRYTLAGGTYFFTLVTHQRCPWLCNDLARSTLRAALLHVQQTHPFTLDAIVLLPNHLHCIWTLPDGDSDDATRWRLIKSYVTKQAAHQLNPEGTFSDSRIKRREDNLWQRRFWEHWIRDEADYVRHCDYIHYNPVRHGLCRIPKEWEFSSFHRFVKEGIYPPDWGSQQDLEIPIGIWDV